jgi:hypothetical protein
MWDKIHTSISNTQKVITNLWLSFLMAAVACIIVFIIFDPDDIIHCLNLSHISQSGAYSIVFFFFWFITASTSMLSTLFLDADNTKNRDIAN